MQIISKKHEARPQEASRHTLRMAGTRITAQRALILEVIQEGRGHLDADEIYRRGRVKQPRLSLSTVYRTMQTLKKLGLVEKVHIDDTHHYYEVRSSTKHQHLVCLGCGKIVEFEYPVSRYVKRNVAAAKDFEIVDTELRMTGYCSQCRPKR